MSRFTPWLRVWVTARFLWILAAIALLLACAPDISLFVPLAIAMGAALAVATLVDAAIGPPAKLISVVRTPPAHFALRTRAELSYTIENASTRSLRIGIIETPVRALRFDVDELDGEVPPRSRTQLVRAVTPLSRGADELKTMYVWYENRIGLLRRRRRIEAST
ncbi:MAG TPA: hypothetical protein VGN14_10340, partial [Candidatus Elarobacter sp.]